MRLPPLKPFLLLVSALYFFSSPCNAQQPSMERQLRELQQRMMELMRQLDQNQGGSFFSSPDSTRFFFHMDTSLKGLGNPFFFSPDSNSRFFFHMDSLLEGSGSDMFRQLPPFQGFDFFNSPWFERPLPQVKPGDDGVERENSEELLPEERLRQEKSTPAPPSKSSKIRTIRI